MAKPQTGGQGGGGGTTKPDRGGSQPGLSRNDDRSNVKNPIHPSHADDQANQKKQQGRT